MADKNPQHPINAQLQYPNGAMYIYSKAGRELKHGMYVEANEAGLAIPFKGGVGRFPPGIAMEMCPEDWYTFIMVRQGEEKVDKPRIVQPVPTPPKEVKVVV